MFLKYTRDIAKNICDLGLNTGRINFEILLRRPHPIRLCRAKSNLRTYDI